MIKADTSRIEQQLAEYKLEVERKLKYMVANFAYRVAQYAISSTPLGDSVKYASYYNARTDLPTIEGLSQGNWQYSTTSNASLQLIAGRKAGDSALDIIEARTSGYKLGDTFYIVNTTPYIADLEADYSPQTNGMGIMQPTIDLIASTYKIDLVQYYKQG
jgi:hypothetical protein